MTSRARHLAILLPLVLATLACVPTPVGRRSPVQETIAPAATSTETATTPPVPTGPTQRPSFVRPTPTPLPTFFVYVVQAGDSLTSIARAFSTTAFSIAAWNRDAYPSLDPDSETYLPNRIKVGWILRLIPNVAINEEGLLDPSPTPSSRAPSSSEPGASTPAGSTGPAPSIGGASVVVQYGSRSVPTVALTFDMGGRLEPALDILGWLVDHDVPATVFPTGRTGTTTTEGLAALDIVAEHTELFDLGNHSWSHPDFRDLDDAAMRDQLDRTEAAMLATINISTKPWFRPPFGGLDDQIPAVVGAAGWGTTVMWDIDTIDWRPESDGGPTTEQIVDKVVSRAEGGSIVLMHLGGFNTLAALPGILGGLRAKGLTPVTLGTMFGS